MAWIYLAESAESQKPWKAMPFRSPIVKTIPTAKGYFLAEWEQAISLLHQSGTMFAHCNEVIFPYFQTLSGAVFRVKMLVLQDCESVWKGSELDYFQRSLDLSMRFDLDSCSLRTCQESLLKDWQPSALSLPRDGMMRDGRIYQQPPLELRTCDSDGFFLPTPTVRMGGYNKSNGKNAKIRLSLEMMARKNSAA